MKGHTKSCDSQNLKTVFKSFSFPMGTKGVLQMLHLPIDIFFGAKVLIIEVQFYVIKLLHIGLEDFCWNRTAVLGDFIFECSVIGSQVGLKQQNWPNATQFPLGYVMLRFCHLFAISARPEHFPWFQLFDSLKHIVFDRSEIPVPTAPALSWIHSLPPCGILAKGSDLQLFISALLKDKYFFFNW